MCEPKASRSLVVTNHEGLHARAATLVADLVRRFDCKVELIKGHERVEATEVLQILSLGAGHGEEIAIEAVGNDARTVIEALARLFAENFAEADEETEETESQP